MGSPRSFRRKRPFISLNCLAFIENLSSSEDARANHAKNDAQKGLAMQLKGITLRLVFTSDGVGVGVIIRSAERFDLVKTMFRFRLRIRRLRCSENWDVGVGSRGGRTKSITKRGNKPCDWFILPLLLLTPAICFSLDR